jgi:hypothetical protein
MPKFPLLQSKLPFKRRADSAEHICLGSPSVHPCDPTRHGPSESGNRSERIRKPIDGLARGATPGGYGVFRDGTDYWKHRAEHMNDLKDDKQLYLDLLGAKSVSPLAGKPLFKGMVFYIDSASCVEVSSYHLTKLISVHGGVVLPYLSGSVSHVLCHNLSASKAARVNRNLGRCGECTRHIRPNFVLDCITEGKLLPEFAYTVSVSGRFPLQQRLLSNTKDEPIGQTAIVVR